MQFTEGIENPLRLKNKPKFRGDTFKFNIHVADKYEHKSCPNRHVTAWKSWARHEITISTLFERAISLNSNQ